MINKIVIISLSVLTSFAFTSLHLSMESTDSFRSNTIETHSTEIALEVSLKEKIKNVYHEFNLNNKQMPSLASFQKGMLGYYKLVENGKIKNEILTIVDFSLPSSKKRMWILDMGARQVLFYTFVAHGQGTGGEMATEFSNRPDSHKSSLGFYLTAETYIGKHGLSLRMDGLENKFNGNARERYIVVHGAAYATADFADRVGRLGRSWGCPAVPEKISKAIIKTIKGKSCFFIYYPSERYLQNSQFLNDGDK